MHLLRSQNKYPDCLQMELEAVSIQSEIFDLYLTLNFNEQWEPLLNGRVKFMLKGGQLKLKLENMEIISSATEFGNSFLVERVELAEIPTWVFSGPTGELFLKDSLKQFKLGTLKAIAQSFGVEAVFEVSGQDISLTDTEGLWRHDISPNKHGILERKLVLFLLQHQFYPYLSCTLLGSEGFEPEQEKEDKKTYSQELFQLQEIIQQIYESTTNNFLELAKIVDLNPLTDLAGGNFLATELSSVDLSGANLCRTNFRGANLTDADLSETNLSHSKLSGADLSGAYIENSNLSYTDLHRASLALATLIDADLSGANLIEANLSSANLSSAKVSEARFGNNPGLNEENIINLQQRGAIFE